MLRSAIANAQQKEGFGGDVERLYVTACYADQGPSQKRIRPAPMGRAFRVVKRTAHLTVHVTERPLEMLRRRSRVRRSGHAAPSRERRRASGAQDRRRETRRAEGSREVNRD